MEGDASKPRSMLLDGAMATNLFQHGMPVEGCHEEWMLQNPMAVRQLQREYLDAGSRLLLTPTFSANRSRLAEFGQEANVTDYNLRLAELTIAEAAGRAEVAGNLSGTGLSLFPAGEVSLDELVEIYTEQADALNRAGVDSFYLETMLSVTEARAAVLACRPYGKPIYVTVALNEDGLLFSEATPLAALLSLQGLGIAGFGFNCAPVEQIVEALQEIRTFAHLPLLAKPCILPEQTLSPEAFAAQCGALLDIGVTRIGGCCGTTPAYIRALSAFLEQYNPVPVPPEMGLEEYDIYLTNTSAVFQLDNDRLEITEPILCSLDMSEELLHAEEDSADVLHIEIETPEDALLFSQNEHFARLPVCFRSDSEAALERALFLYNGRCMVDRESAVEEDVLCRLAARYGAVLY